jgi:hypothetical protein
MCCVLAGAVLSQGTMTTIEEEAFSAKTQPPAVFEHDEHHARAGIRDCSVCHHVYENGKRVPGAVSVGQECSSCHPAQSKGFNLKYAYHTLCISCHLERDKGALTCRECHPGDTTQRITEEAFRSPERDFSVFSHTTHVRSAGLANCTVCHHNLPRQSDLSRPIRGQECSDCHLLDMDRGAAPNLMDAYHQSCQPCHWEKGQGPLACGECHVKSASGSFDPSDVD